MSMLDTLEISSSGLAAQRMRMKVISSNIANVNTTRTPGGGAYRRKDVVFGALPAEKNFYNELLSAGVSDDGLRHVKVLGVVEDARPMRMKYDPTHPDANEDGYVELPNVDIMEEMTNLMVSRRSFEANIAAVNATKNMIVKTLEIGRG